MRRRRAVLAAACLGLAVAAAPASAATPGPYYPTAKGATSIEIYVSAGGRTIKRIEVDCRAPVLGGEIIVFGAVNTGDAVRIPITKAGQFSFSGTGFLRTIRGVQRVKVTYRGSFSGERVRGTYAIVAPPEAPRCQKGGLFSAKLWKEAVQGGA